MSVKVEEIKAAIRGVLKERPQLTAPEVYAILKDRGDVALCAETSFCQFHVTAVRKELGINARGLGGRARGRNAAAVRPPAPATENGRKKAPAPPDAGPPAPPPPPPARGSAREIRILGPGVVLVATPVGTSWDVELAARVDEVAMRRLAALVAEVVTGAAA